MGLCGLRCTLGEDEELKYVLCSSHFGNCGRLRHSVYVLESDAIECWGTMIRTEQGARRKYFCDTTIPFNLVKVLRSYLSDRAVDLPNPVFDPLRYEKRFDDI
jgi:hypothetical protein